MDYPKEAIKPKEVVIEQGYVKPVTADDIPYTFKVTRIVSGLPYPKQGHIYLVVTTPTHTAVELIKANLPYAVKDTIAKSFVWRIVNYGTNN